MTLLQAALSQYGVSEIKGQEDNPAIIKYFEDCGWNGKQLKDETAWCSCFLNWCALEAGVERSMALDARSWLKVGKIIDNPVPGDVVIFWRISKNNNWQGHVGLFCRKQGDSIFTLGGNQGIGQVNIMPYQTCGRTMGLLGFRRLNSYL